MYTEGSTLRNGGKLFTLVENPTNVGGTTYAEALCSDGCSYNVVWHKDCKTNRYDWDDPDFILVSDNE